MNRPLRCNRPLLAALVAAAAALSLTPVAGAEPDAPAVPGQIAVPSGNKPFLVGHAVGVQIYSCTAGGAGFAWTFVAPRADLYGDNGTLIATHFAGPTWQARDGSTAATTGGLAPAAAACSAETAGAQVEVPYTADYYFWKATGG